MPLFNTTDRREDRYEMEHMQAAFVQNQFFSTSDLKIKSPSYIDVSHYGSLGSLSRLNFFAEKRTEKRVAAFDEMIDRAKKYTLVTKSDPNEKIVEFVFHLGDHTQKPRGFNQEVKHYSGVNPKYFEDRFDNP